MTVETTTEAWRRRGAMSGSIDFTMMYVAHDAFRRDLARLNQAVESDAANRRESRATWEMFSRQLHTHHEAEDASLWPRVRDAELGKHDEDVLAVMEAEHSQLEPLLDEVDGSLADGRPELDSLAALASLLDQHMRNEEVHALPQVERSIGQAGWDAFGKDIRDAQGGIKAGATYLPWVLDDAPDSARQTVLKVLPPPARLLYRMRWEPRYRRSLRLA
jgi:hemerythrin-like domain-containing protein